MGQPAPDIEYKAMKHNPAFLPGLMFVLSVRRALFSFLFNPDEIPPSLQMATLMVNSSPSFPPKEESKPEPPPPLPKPQPSKKPKSRQLVAEKPVVAEAE